MTTDEVINEAVFQAVVAKLKDFCATRLAQGVSKATQYRIERLHTVDKSMVTATADITQVDVERSAITSLQ